MTVQTTTNVATGIGNDVTTVFPFNFKLTSETDLVVLDVTTADETYTELTLGSDYTVQGVGSENGGSITLTAPLPIGHKVKMARELDILQQTDLRNQGKFFAETHEEAFDRFIMIAQQLQNAVDRSVKVPITSDTPADELYQEFKDDISQADQAATTAIAAKNEAQSIANKFGDVDSAVTLTEALRDQAAASAAESSASQALATSNADRAELAADTAVGNVDVYDDTAAGLAATTEGEQFQVLSADNTEFIRYRHDAGPTATEVGRYPSAESVNALEDKVRASTGPFFSVTDEAGFLVMEYTAGGLETPEMRAEQGVFTVKGVCEIRGGSAAPDVALLVVDEYGFVGFRSTDNGAAERDASNIAHAMSLRSMLNSSTAPVAYDYNVVLMYGQSLSNGTEGWPALTTTAMEPGNILMIGDSPRPNSGHGTWAPVGTLAWSDLIEVVQSADDTSILTPAEVAALSPGSQNKGETGGAAALHFWRELQLGFRGKLTDPDRKMVFINCGCGGRTVEQLSKGASPELYARITSALTAAKSLADGESKTIGLVGVIYAQGEYNYRPDFGGTTDKAAFKALTAQLFDDIYSDAQSILGAQLPPAFITYQTGGSYTRDSTDLSIGMAQLELSKERDNVYLAAPNYHVVDKNGHLSANGYRWLGHHYGEVMHRVLDRRENWFPLHPIKAQVSGRTIYVDFAVPVPPLQSRPAYNATSPVVRSDLGFKVTDSGGEVALASVSIAGATVVKIELAEDINGAAKLWYAPQSAGGNGNLFDSNSLKALYDFEYNAGTGQYASENIAALVGKPYPLNNPCAAFCIDMEII